MKAGAHNPERLAAALLDIIETVEFFENTHNTMTKAAKETEDTLRKDGLNYRALVAKKASGAIRAAIAYHLRRMGP